MDSALTLQEERRALLKDSSVLEALQLAERVQSLKGQPLDDDDLHAVAETTGVSVEYVRLVYEAKESQEDTSKLSAIRRQYAALNTDTKRYVASAMFAVAGALVTQLGFRISLGLQAFAGNKVEYSFFQMVGMLVLAGAAYNSAMAKNKLVAGISGAIAGLSFCLISALFAMLFLLPVSSEPFMILFYGFGGFLAGQIIYDLVQKNGKKYGLQSQAESRQELLKQLVELQDRLKEGKQNATFLSLDIVGSTRLKMDADPLAVEFTFSEYQNYVASIVAKHGGRIHNTSGDGTTCAFDHPQQAFAAARNIQAGMIEFNSLRNKLAGPVAVRAGIHMGEVVVPSAGDLTTVNYSGVIDTAAHLQKEAPPGGIAISVDSAQTLRGGVDAVGGTQITVGTVQARVWRPTVALPSTPLAAVPPPPVNS